MARIMVVVVHVSLKIYFFLTLYIGESGFVKRGALPWGPVLTIFGTMKGATIGG